MMIFNMIKFEFCEIFKSIQGERKLEGIPTVFLRFIRCNLNCSWCDSKDLMKKNTRISLSISEILEKLKESKCTYVVLTGGEPLLDKNIEILVKVLKQNGYHVTVETNGTIFRNINCDLISISPKLNHSNNLEINIDKNIRTILQLINNCDDYQIKFVVRPDETDFEEVKKYVNCMNLQDSYLDKVMVMPLSNSKNELEDVQADVVRLSIKYNFRYADRLQLHIWDNEEEK